MSALADPASATDRPVCADLPAAARALATLRAGLPAGGISLPLPREQIEFPRMEVVAGKFGLSAIEEAVLLQLALEEIIDPAAAALARPASPPTLEYLAQLWPEAGDLRWLLPEAPLRRWHFVEIHSRRQECVPLARQPLRISERLLGHLLGSSAPDARLEPALLFTAPPPVLTPRQLECARSLAAGWSAATHFEAFRPVALSGREPSAARAIAWEGARLAGLGIAELRLGLLPESAAERREWLRLWQVEALLTNRALFLDASDGDPAESAQVAEWLRQPGGATVVALRTDALPPASAVRVHVPPTDARDRAELISAFLNGHTPKEPGFVTTLADRFDLGAVAVYEACRDVTATSDPTAAGLWAHCRQQARPKLGSLVQTIESRMDWSDLILPPEQLQVLREAVSQVRYRTLVHQQWGFAAKSTRGLNLTALFSGSSGTGKTLAAEVIANDLGLDLLRVDLSTVVSKYIGETEKNLNQVFEAAETGGAVLLFDEADALFGTRSKVSDSRDRYANMEVSFLLQRLESYRGLAILTTNLRENIDTAFLRRIRFHVEFPFPDRTTRAQLWRSALPAGLPVAQLDFDRLSRLSLTGGHIRNVVLNAAFLAAEAGGPLQLRHLATAARGEFRKSDKPVPEGELRQLLEPLESSLAS